MKNIIIKSLLSLMGVVLVCSNFAQIELKSNGVKVKELTNDMTNVDIRVNFPKEIQDYDKIIVLVFKYNNAEMTGQLYDAAYSIKHLQPEFKSWTYKDYKLVDGASSSFKQSAYPYRPYDLTSPGKDPMRKFENIYNKVVIKGGTHEGWAWEGNEQVKTYNYVVLKEYSFVHKVGPIDPNIYTGSLEFGIKREKIEALEMTKEYGTSSLELYSRPSDSRNSWIHVDMKYSDEKTAEDIKTALQIEIIKSSNQKSPSSLMSLTGVNSICYEKVLIGNNEEAKEEKGSKFKSGFNKLANAYGVGESQSELDKEKLDILINTADTYFEWNKKVINGQEYEVLEIPYYEEGQTMKDEKKKLKIKEEEVGKTKLLRYWVTEKNGKVYFVGAFERDAIAQSEEFLSLVNYIDKSLIIK